MSRVLAGAAALVALSAAAAEQANGPASVAEARALAAQHGRPVLIDFMTDW
jgi:hypothetical protein